MKKLVLIISEALIQMGIFLQNLYQPSIEDTVLRYRHHTQRKIADSGEGNNSEFPADTLFISFPEKYVF